MNEVSAPIFSLSTAAISIGVTPKTLRHWVDRGHVKIAAERTPGGHYRFSWGDILVLSIVAELSRWGFTIEDAYEQTSHARQHIGMLGLYKRAPLAALEAAITPVHYLIEKKGEDQHKLYVVNGTFGPISANERNTYRTTLHVSPLGIFRAAKVRAEEWEDGLDDREIGPDGKYYGAVLDGGPIAPDELAKIIKE